MQEEYLAPPLRCWAVASIELGVMHTLSVETRKSRTAKTDQEFTI